MDIRFQRLTLLGMLISLYFTPAPAQHPEPGSRVFFFGQMPLTEEHTDQVLQWVEPEEEDIETTVIFIGGFLPGSDTDGLISRIRKFTEKDIKIQLIPGDLEWNVLGVEGIIDFEDKLKEEFDYDILLPDNACGELDIEDLENDLSFVVIDSEWYLRMWENEENINRTCDVSTRFLFWRNLREEMGALREKQVVLLSFHPPVRYDNNAGYYPLVDHIFPLRKLIDGLYLPLPLVGSLGLHTHSWLSGRQHITHPAYRDFAGELENLVEDYPNTYVVSGQATHLCVDKFEESWTMNVYSGSQPGFVRQNAYFSGRERGFIQFDRTDSSVLLSLKTIDPGGEPETVFQKLLEDRERISDRKTRDSLYWANKPRMASRVDTSILKRGEIYDLNGFWWGQLNTDIYFRDISVPPLYIDTFKGGLEPIRLGGGNQTKTMNLETEDGKIYKIRSLKKEARNLLPEPFNFSILRNVVEFHFTAPNPYGFLTTPVLEERLGLLHFEPKLYYLPAQKGLGKYNDELAGGLYMLRERADGEWKENERLGNSEEYNGSMTLLEDIRKGKAIANHRRYLKARLLDMLISDWDRHEDQWRWAEDPEEVSGMKLYHPIARDRDQAYSNFDGFLVFLTKQYNQYIHSFSPYSDKLNDYRVKWLHYEGRQLDNALLANLNRGEWNEIVREVKEELDEDVIREAISRMPEEVGDEVKKELVRKLKARVSQLDRVGNTYFEELNKRLFFFGTHERDSIIITETEDRHVRLQIWIQTDEGWYLRTDRVIEPSVTRFMTVYGQDGDDLFISDRGINGLRINLVDGFGDDDFRQDDEGGGRRLHVYGDDEQFSEIPKAYQYHFTKSEEIHQTGVRRYKTPRGMIWPELAYNSDDGIFLGARYQWLDFNFAKEFSHSFSVTYAFKTGSLQSAYEMNITDLLRKRDLYFEAGYLGPRYVFNFFGFGNDSPIDLERERDYYYVRLEQIKLAGGFRYNINDLGYLKTGLMVEGVGTDRSENRFIDNTEEVDPEVFDWQYFAGGQIRFHLENMDERFRPNDGILFEIELTPRLHIQDPDRSHINFKSKFGFYESLHPADAIVLSSQVSYEHIFGDYFFYHAPRVGGDHGLRGFRSERFYGESAFYHNTNLHFEVVERAFEKVFPTTIGLSLGFDYGRVWYKGDTAGELHTSWGGGLFLSPFGYFVLSGGVFRSKEETQFIVEAGYFF